MESGRALVLKAQNNVRMAGFLEKKGKMKFMSAWKKYWFVLEERLLLYYRSEVEYTNLSPCRGSLNMGLVSTVRPGSSAGPCVIHVITRTQVVQLRAENRTMQEEWLQALLNSMSLPLVKKTLKPPIPKTCFLGSSLDNVFFEDKLKNRDFESEVAIPRVLDYRKRQISGTLYGGSLDTAIWSKKCKQSPSISKSKMLEKILGFPKESDPFSLKTVLHKNSRVSLIDENEMKYLGNHERSPFDKDYERKRIIKCKMHDENRNHDIYSIVDKTRKTIKKTWSDTELNRRSTFQNSEYDSIEKKDESPFGRIRNALSRSSKEKMSKFTKQETEKKGRSSKKRRRSFLQKVFRKKDYDNYEFDSDINDPLYYTIDHVQEPQDATPEMFSKNQKISSEKAESKSSDSITSEEVQESLYSEIHKVVAGSKTIMPAQAMSELRVKLKSRESLEKHYAKVLESPKEERKQSGNMSPPSLPPRRMSRPISPWHDVPTNNAPVNSDKKSFFVHQSLVKFNDSKKISKTELPHIESEFSNDLRFEEEEDSNKGSSEFKELPADDKKKNDDLTVLLEQLTEITVAPLAQLEGTDDNYNCPSDSELIWPKYQLSDPDYDIPRPHKPVKILISQKNEVISSTEFLGRRDDNSDTSLSFQSMEPDSLEATEKN